MLLGRTGSKCYLTPRRSPPLYTPLLTPDQVARSWGDCEHSRVSCLPPLRAAPDPGGRRSCLIFSPTRPPRKDRHDRHRDSSYYVRSKSADRSSGSATELHRLSVFGEDAREHELCATCRGLGMAISRRDERREGERACEQCAWGEEPARASSSQRTLATGEPAHTGSHRLSPALGACGS